MTPVRRMWADFKALRGPLAIAICVIVALGSPVVWYYRDRIATDAEARATAELRTEAERSADLLERRSLRYEALQGLAAIVTAADSAIKAGGSIGGAMALDELRANLALDRHEIAYVTGMDSRGRVLWSTDQIVEISADLSNEEHVRAIISGPAHATVGAPSVGRMSRVLAFRLSKGVYGKDGALVGINTLSVDPMQITRLILPAGTGAGQFSAILRADGLLLGTSRAALTGLPLPAEVLAATLKGGTAMAKVRLDDGTPYRVALRRADPFDLIALVGHTEASFDASSAVAHYDIAIVGIIGFLLLTLVIITGAFAAHRRAEVERYARLEAEAGMAKVRQVTDNLQDMVILWEETGPGNRRFTFVSPSCQEFLGVPASALMADNTLYRYHPADVGLVRERMADLRLGNTLPYSEVRLVRPDASVIWVEASSDNISAGPGERREYITCLHDITERKETENALGEATRRIASLTNNSPGVLYELELEEIEDGTLRANVTYVSRGLERMLGYPPEWLRIPGTFPTITEPGSFEMRQAAFRRCLAEGQAGCKFVYFAANGSRVSVRDKFTLLRRTPKGGVIVGYMTDVTEEEALRRQLTEAAKLSFLGEMAAGIAHELHQPLSAISLQADTLALTHRADSDQHPLVLRFTEKITALCGRAATVIRRVQAFSRRNTDAAAPFDPAVAISDALGIMQSRLREADIVLAQHFPEIHVMVMGHEAPFVQVLTNLIGNAIDAYELAADRRHAPRPIELGITRNGGQVVVTVADRAGGIPAHVLSRIFEPFFTTKPIGRGTGLGLSISRRIIEDMGATIDAVVEDGGTRFSIVLVAVQNELVAC